MIRIIIVEDHTLFRDGIKSLLANFKDIEVVAEFSNGIEFCEQIFDCEADIVLMDIEMPEMNGIEATKKVKIKCSSLKVIVLSMYSDQKYYSQMIKAGVSGFVLKEASTKELEKAIRDVYSGLEFFSPELLQNKAISEKKSETNDKIKSLQLTDREMEILNNICQGLSNKEISNKLFLSPKTVESHKTKLLRKTDTKNSSGLIIFAIKNQLVDIWHY